jgi:hypothetical protein
VTAGVSVPAMVVVLKPRIQARSLFLCPAS